MKLISVTIVKSVLSLRHLGVNSSYMSSKKMGYSLLFNPGIFNNIINIAAIAGILNIAAS
jgi:hypothetical protein